MTKKTYQINTNRGVDLSSSPLSVAPSRASYMKNMISKGGINHKRNGWNEIVHFEDADGNKFSINGIFEYTEEASNKRTRYFIVHGLRYNEETELFEGKFFRYEDDFIYKDELTLPSDISFNGEKYKGYQHEGKLWLIGGGDYLVYNGTGAIFKIDALGQAFAYAPTTSIESVIGEEIAIESFEDVNLLTNKRKNKRIGIARTGDNDGFNCFLDGKILFNTPLSVRIEINAVGYGIASSDAVKENQVCVFAKKNGEKYWGIVSYGYDIESVQNSTYEPNVAGIKLYTAEVDENGEFKKDEDGELVLTEFKPQISFGNDGENGVITFCSNVVTPMPGYNNITVEYYADYSRSIDLTSSAVFTQTNGVDMLLVANGANTIYYTGVDSPDNKWDFGYISAEKFIGFGDDNDPITAIVPMNDSVGVFKGDSFYRIKFIFNDDSETYEAEYVPQITEAIDNTGCINQFVHCNVNGDTLIFDGTGIYGIEYSSSQRSLKLRSSNVSKAFEGYTSEQLKNAVALSHQGRYYLFIAGDVYIADSRFKVYESNRLDTSFEYEWWVWDNCPATMACSIDGRLYLGKKNGKIAVFDDKYSDREMLIAGVANVSCESYNGYSKFTFNEALEVKDGDKVTLKNCYRLLAELTSNEISKVKDGLYKLKRKIEADDKGNITGEFKGIYIGMKLYLGTLEYEGEVKDYDAFDNSFTVQAGGYSATVETVNGARVETVNIYADVTGIPYTVTERDVANGKTELVLTSEGQAIELYDFGEIEATILRETPVRCEYHTPVIDLGSSLHLKTLWQLAITVSKETEGKVELGYQSNNKSALAQRYVGRALDFEAFDFYTFVFDGAFYKTQIKRMYERNFNYILFKLASESNSDFAIERFSCVYSTNNKLLRGDR